MIFFKLPIVLIKPLLTYPQQAEFEELLNSCGSMTKQLEDLGQQLRVELLHEGIEDNYFRRYSLLHLNQRAVVIACSSTDVSAEFFSALLKNANTTPIGKFLFASQSQVQRNPEMQIELVTIKQVHEPHLQDYLRQHYQTDQEFWQRKSEFNYRDQRLNLIEILLPEFTDFFSE
jgi:chorismate-pyruvate lyase